MKVKWKGPVSDPSGYGKANRDYVDALHRHISNNLTVESINHEYITPGYFGEKGDLALQLRNNSIDYDVVVNHCVPNAIANRVESGKFNVGYNTWETDALPDHWVDKMNKNLDLVLVPSYFNKEVYENSGVRIPVEVVSHCLDQKEIVNENGSMDEYLEKYNDRFKFLSIFQWTERKNPIGLLKSYFIQFYNQDDVVLILKSYRSNTSQREQSAIREQIQGLKKDLRLDPEKTPKIVFIGGMLTSEQIHSLYNGCDCFVLPTRGEGFGLPFAEAAMSGCKVVAPNQGGQKDFLEGLDTAFLSNNYFMTPVSGMPWIPNYNGLMNWVEPDLMEFMEKMSQAKHWKLPPVEIKRSMNTIQKQLDPNKVGKDMLDKIKKHMR